MARPAVEVVTVTEEVRNRWARGEVLCCAPPSSSVVVLVEISMDLGDILEGVPLRRSTSRDDFDLVGTIYKRREGIAATTQNIWTERKFALRDGHVRYYEIDESDWESPRNFADLNAGVSLLKSEAVLDSPTPFVAEILWSSNESWLLAFESSEGRELWLRALYTAKGRPDKRKSYDYSLYSAVTTQRPRRRYAVFEARTRDSFAEQLFVEKIEEAESAMDLDFASKLAKKEQGDNTVSLMQLDARCGIWEALDRTEESEFAARVAEVARDEVDPVLKSLERLALVVRPSYAAAHLVVPQVPALLRVESSRKETLGQGRPGETAVDEAAIVDKVFSNEEDVGAACRASRRALCGAAANELEAAMLKRLGGRVASLRGEVLRVGERARSFKTTLVDSLATAVTSGAWVGKNSPSADLYSRFDAAAAGKECALAKFAVTLGTHSPGTLFVGDSAVYFAPSTHSVAKFFGSLAAAAASSSASLPDNEGPLRIDLRSIALIDRVSSPIPLKTNALYLVTSSTNHRNNNKSSSPLVFTLNSPGASVQTLVDLVDACRYRIHLLEQQQQQQQQASRQEEQQTPVVEPSPAVEDDDFISF